MQQSHLKKVKRANKIAHFVVSSSGILVVACLITMVILMIRVTLPLFQSPQIEVLAETENAEQSPDDILAMGLGPYLEKGWTLDRAGQLAICDLKNNTWTFQPLVSEPVVRCDALGQSWTFQTETGAVYALNVDFKPFFAQDGTRTIQVETHLSDPFVAQVGERNLLVVKDQNRILCQQMADGSLKIYKETQEEDLFGDITRSQSEWQLETQAVKSFSLSSDGARLILSADNRLQLWDLSAEEPQRLDETAPDTRNAVSALAFSFGDQSILSAYQSGRISAWFLVDGKLMEVHEFPGNFTARDLRISARDKRFWAIGETQAQSWQLTTERELGKITTAQTIQAMGVNESFTGAWVHEQPKGFQLFAVKAPHGDVSFGALWQKVWYEGYPKPEYVWQSSASSDDAEAKLSLVPLVFGSLKGTFYGLLFALPLAFGAAFYVSYLMEPKLKKWIKPLLELMAAIPSVVIGFIAALWLAPRLEGIVPTIFMAVVFVPICLIFGSWLIRPLERKYKVLGWEFVWVLPLLIIALFVAYRSGVWVEAAFMGGNFKLWYFETFHGHFDYRNCMVVGMALGFTVFPIVFTISEDALSNVPPAMTAASLALGASRWQTLRKVVLPMASPGLFAATMIGLGRAVGETMIVLMATGNTPIMDFSIFNGMRTLSATIATEIPEAPVGGSLYRILFLSGLLLFALTFIINSLAELVRSRLKQKYAHF
ncbi:MAG: ABC transporter permease subunit [Acidobacteria bacterium]|nr:ABC transporter permease subunit [Acidobacteriota bacterium]MCB9399102.1 ABC transporter permease subunit [Acidobacteriota bacterium]